jgi:predicted anti-sigma-YlaC factor YlaD
VHNSAPHEDGHPAGGFDVATDEVTCQQFVELITAYFEGTLATGTLSRVEEHLVMCDWCVTYLEQIKLTIELLGDLREPTVPEPASALVAALRARRSTRR